MSAIRSKVAFDTAHPLVPPPLIIGLPPRSESVAVEIAIKHAPDIVNPTTEVVNHAESSSDLGAVLYL
jgi:hypothetical protein